MSLECLTIECNTIHGVAKTSLGKMVRLMARNGTYVGMGQAQEHKLMGPDQEHMLEGWAHDAPVPGHRAHAYGPGPDPCYIGCYMLWQPSELP